MLTTDFTPGAPIWVDLGAPVIAEATEFYGKLLGWEFQDLGPQAGGYHLCRLRDRTVAAIGPATDPAVPPQWTVYFRSDDADATAKTVEQAGGRVLFAPMDVGPMGRMAVFADPAGARFAVWQPGTVPGLEAVTEPGTLCWTELYTTDPAAAQRFYSTVFGWDFAAYPMEDYPGGSYTVINRAGREEDRSLGGLVPIVPEMAASGVTPLWQSYFEVADCDAAAATAQRSGGELVRPPMTVPGVGRWAHLKDPAGARFSVITSAQQSA